MRGILLVQSVQGVDSLIRVIMFGSFLVVALLGSDWANWRRYYPTILFFMVSSLLYDVLSINFPLWHFEALPPLHNILSNNTLLSLGNTLVIFPATGMLYLSRYPEGKKQYPYVLLWALLYAFFELVEQRTSGITYHNGWTYAYSATFDLGMFTILRLHYLRPLAAWAVTFFTAVTLLYLFRFPVSSLP
jgi:hypothetical protein